MDITEQARRIFSQDRYATEATGIVIDSVGEHESQCRMTVESRHCNARGMAMGGALFTLGDFASAVAANNDGIHWVSLDATIHFLAPAPQGAMLVARATALKHGRTTALYQTIIESPDNGKRVAIVETTMVRV